MVSSPVFASAGEARLAIGLLLLAFALVIFAIRMFCRFVAWLTPDGHPLRRLVVAGLLLLPVALLLLPVFPPAVEAATRQLDSPESREAERLKHQPRPSEPIKPGKPIGHLPGEKLTLPIDSSISSIAAHHRYRNFHVVLQIGTAEQTIPVANLDLKGKDWGHTIQVRYGQEDQKPNLEIGITLPDDESLYGSEATLVITGQVEYPRKAWTQIDSFTEETYQVHLSSPIRFLTREAATKAQELDLAYREAMKRYEKEREDRNRAERSWETYRTSSTAREQARALLCWSWIGIPLSLLAVPLVCRFKRGEDCSRGRKRGYRRPDESDDQDSLPRYRQKQPRAASKDEILDALPAD